MTINAYPLHWPQHFQRAKSREKGAFKTSLSAALNNVQDSLRLFSQDSGKKLENVVISSNVTLGATNPSDPGVAVWFIWDGLQICIPVDRYQKIESNLQAIHHIIEARRVELRHGTLALVRATFSGFLSLSNSSSSDWWNVFGVNRDASHDTIKTSYQVLRSKYHPDREGGDAAQFDRVQKAWKQYEAQR